MTNTKTKDVTSTPTDGNNLVPLVPSTTTAVAVAVATDDVNAISDLGDDTVITATATATATAVPTVLATATSTATAISTPTTSASTPTVASSSSSSSQPTYDMYNKTSTAADAADAAIADDVNVNVNANVNTISDQGDDTVITSTLATATATAIPTPTTSTAAATATTATSSSSSSLSQPTYDKYNKTSITADAAVATADVNVNTISDQGDNDTVLTSTTTTATTTATATATATAIRTPTTTSSPPRHPTDADKYNKTTSTTSVSSDAIIQERNSTLSHSTPQDIELAARQQQQQQQQQQQKQNDMGKANNNSNKKNGGGSGGGPTQRRISFAKELVNMNHYDTEDEKKDNTDPSPSSQSSSQSRTSNKTGVFCSSSLRSQQCQKDNISSSSIKSVQSLPSRAPRTTTTMDNRTGVFHSSSIRSRRRQEQKRASSHSLTQDRSLTSLHRFDSNTSLMSARGEDRISSLSTRPAFRNPTVTESMEGRQLDAYMESWRQEAKSDELAQKGMLLSSLASMPERERLPLKEDVYAFIIVCPVWSVPFWYAMYCILLKYTIYGILLSDIKNDEMYAEVGYDEDTGDIIPPEDWDGERRKLVQVVKFFLIPVAVAMQEDLMTVFANVANKEYDDTVMKYTKSATEVKFVASNLMRLVDGLMSLTVNFYVMLMTNTILAVFLNFAALHFLQYIDDVCYDLVEQGFLGDSMEYVTNLCKQVTFKRRFTYHKDDNDNDDDYQMTQYEKWSQSITNLDTILMSATLLVCIIIYGFVEWYFYADHLIQD